MKKLGFILFILLHLQWSINGQRILFGQVLNEKEESLIGVNIQIKGTPKGTVSDFQGKFQIAIESEFQILVFSYTGYETKELEVGVGNEILVIFNKRIVLKEGDGTALGILREKKSLGNAGKDINGEELSRVRDGNILSTLQGKLAGVQITSSSGQVGASARIVIRGNSSIFGNNQPLFVVNGVPTDNSSFSAEAKYGGTDYGNAISDINPEEIESLSVLKGPAASCLYGSRAINGVVLITTKTGKNDIKKGLGISYSSSVGFSMPLSFWKLQDKFGQGNKQQFKYVDGTGSHPDAIFDGTDESWGPAFDISINEHDGIDNDGNGQIDEQSEGTLIDQHTGKQQLWRAHPNSLLKSMDVGQDYTNYIAITNKGEKGYTRFSYTNYTQRGTIPTTELRRNSANLSYGMELSQKLSTDGKISYVRTDSRNRSPVGYFGNFTFQTTWSGRQVDFEELKRNWNRIDEFGRPYNWNHNFYNNPFWELNNNKKPMNRDRVNAYYSLNYKMVDWLSITGRASNDFYREFRKQLNAQVPKWNYLGGFTEDHYNVNELNTDIIVTAKPNLTKSLSFAATVGANHLIRKMSLNALLVDGLTVPGIYTASNAAISTKLSQFESKKIINSVFANASLAYNNWMYLDVSGRNDWSSTLPKIENSYFYPSLSLALVLSEKLEMGKYIDYLKLRGGIARVGSDTDPYQLKFTYATNNAWKNIPAFTVPDQLTNNKLKPEIKTSWEVGFESFAFNKRMGFDVTYYYSLSKNQILPVDVSGSTGFSSRIINAGTILNKGLEIQLSVDPVKSRNVSWNVVLNWSTNISEVKELPPGVDEIVIGDNGGCLLVARLGEPYGVLRGTQLLRNTEGKLILEGGLPKVDPVGNVNLGTISPKWFGGIKNVISYKAFSLNTLIDARFGSSFLSWGYLSARYAGILEETLEGRQTLDEIKNGYAFDGVIENVDGTFRPNDVKVSAEEWNKHFPWYIGGDFKRGVLDGSFVKFREISLAYTFPKSLYSKLRMQSMNVGVYVRNAFWIYRGQKHYDPDYEYTTRNDDQGQEVNQPPALRTIGIQINTSF